MWPIICLSLAMLFWASNVVIARGFRADLPPMWLGFWRWVIGSAVLLPFLWRPLWEQRRAVWSLRWHYLVQAGIGIVGTSVCIYLGVATASATSAAALQTPTPAWILLIAAVLHGKRLSLNQVVGVAISMFGALFIAVEGDMARLALLELGRGEMWLLASSVCWAIYTLSLDAMPKKVSTSVSMLVQMLLGAAILLPMAMYAEPGVPMPGSQSWSALLAVLYLGIFPSVLAYSLYNIGVNRLGSQTAGSFDNLMPAFSSFLSIGFLGESLMPFHLLGFLACVVGVTLTSVDWHPFRRPVEH